MHLCAELTAAFWTLEPFGEIGANFSLQLSSRTRFDKINKKKVIAENQCEKHKKSSLVNCVHDESCREKLAPTSPSGSLIIDAAINSAYRCTL